MRALSRWYVKTDRTLGSRATAVRVSRFQTRPSLRPDDRCIFCAMCYVRSYNVSGVEENTMHNHICIVCGVQFQSKKRLQKTCSLSCRGRQAGRAESKRVCPCGKPASKRGWCIECALTRKREARKRSYYKHRDKINEEKRHFYNENRDIILKRNKCNSNRRRFNGLRIARLEYDNFTCRSCGVTTQLIVHHRERRKSREEPDITSTIDDLVTLCRACHARLHARNGDLKPKRELTVC